MYDVQESMYLGRRFFLAPSSLGITLRLAKNVADRIKNFSLEKVSIWFLPPLYKEWFVQRKVSPGCLLTERQSKGNTWEI